MKRRRIFWPLGLVLILAAGIGFLMGSATRPAGAENGPVTFDYRVEAVPVAAIRQYEQAMSEVRDGGWRLVEVEGTFLFFERAR